MSKKKRAEKLIGKTIDLGQYLGVPHFGNAQILNIAFDTPWKSPMNEKHLCIHVQFLNEHMKKYISEYRDAVIKMKNFDKIGTNANFIYSDRRIHKFIK